ncbi:hypothetical protein SUGI_0483310 [Cryptomeria japonica]|uniref:LRR receptor-like serine/threonine-protein kinase RGI5 n=1 Tax=Cryptomeria japonica TaxID=3369 RepID=UPI002408D336|nr:LRR receptor-like serine/threonine-protein kinase RGI5 [Cryptomeria japonica]GLJ25248.1 hypothetical protein SUGI_0483310 [Cryptomeria japonica]
MKMWQWIFLCCMTLIGFTDAITVGSDVEAMKELKDSVNPGSIPAGSCLSSWNFSVDPCDTAFRQYFTCGIRCAGSPARVTEITLDAAGYNGSLTPGIAKLAALQILDLSNNLFAGEIPSSFQNLSSLQRLLLSHNRFSGNIPESVGGLQSLEQLSLDNNILQGSIPRALGGLKKLIRLELQGNRLSGDFPDLSGAQSLTFLDASDNLLSGNFPANALPPPLVELSLRNNRLSGTLWLDLAKLELLQVVDLSSNQLSGDLQSGFFNHPSLQQLTLSHNGFTSVQVPGNYGTNSELIAVDLSFNQIQGPLPTFMATMPRLSSLSLQYNYFTGTIPFQYAMKASSSLAGKEPLLRLFLSGNYLFGQIPAPFFHLSSDNAQLSFVDNCLLDCPAAFLFCQGGNQKTQSTCRSFTPLVP